ncbi:hypothetical protein [Acidovorax sp. 99]|uniref:methyltransferase family protein n=1 Tax=Acidovorax sp. 99 TaxID=2135634 RepID=UPI001057ABF4|nr:hypothetical protein [Acidovorax sp. 99]
MTMQTLATAEQRAAAHQLLELIGGSWATQAIGVAARLGLADHVASGVMQVVNLVKVCDCDADALHRLLRGLAALGVLGLDGHGQCRLTTTGDLLRRDAALGLSSHAQWWSPQAWGGWSDLMGSVRTATDFHSLLLAAGFSVRHVLLAGGSFSVIEARILPAGEVKAITG